MRELGAKALKDFKKQRLGVLREDAEAHGVSLPLH
jgi:hypothetical protein